jgi:hypothetical protein
MLYILRAVEGPRRIKIGKSGSENGPLRRFQVQSGGSSAVLEKVWEFSTGEEGDDFWDRKFKSFLKPWWVHHEWYEDVLLYSDFVGCCIAKKHGSAAEVFCELERITGPSYLRQLSKMTLVAAAESYIAEVRLPENEEDWLRTALRFASGLKPKDLNGKDRASLRKSLRLFEGIRHDDNLIKCQRIGSLLAFFEWWDNYVLQSEPDADSRAVAKKHLAYDQVWRFVYQNYFGPTGRMTRRVRCMEAVFTHEGMDMRGIVHQAAIDGFTIRQFERVDQYFWRPAFTYHVRLQDVSALRPQYQIAY